MDNYRYVTDLQKNEITYTSIRLLYHTNIDQPKRSHLSCTRPFFGQMDVRVVSQEL